MLRVVFVASEMAPFAKVGGLADVVASLPRALKRLGNRVTVIHPLYGTIDREGHRLEPAGIEIQAWMDGRGRRASLWKADAGGIPVYFLANDDYFEGRAIYGNEAGDYPDNAFRFAFFTRAAIETVRALGLEPDVVHVHDWQTALVPLYWKLPAEHAIPPPVVLTVHNLAYQGLFPRAWLERLALPEELFHIDGVEFYGRINFLKGGLFAADRLTTVSPTYAREIQTREQGAGLEGVVRTRAGSLIGVRNGIEPSDWDPGKDPALVAHYSEASLGGKKRGKRALQEELGLVREATAPLLSVIGRLDPQKGFDLLIEAAPRLVAAGAQIAVLGSGKLTYLRRLQRLARRYPGAIAALEGFRDALGRRIYAGSDLFLMPSRYEPCGLGQMIALRYGTLPVVRETGGLADTVRDLDRDPQGGNGFVFREYTAEALVAAVERALGHYRRGDRWEQWLRRGMREDFSWDQSAGRYLELYQDALSK